MGLARCRLAHDGGPALVLQDGRELLGVGLGLFVHQHDQGHVRVVRREVVGLDLDGLVADARVELPDLPFDERLECRDRPHPMHPGRRRAGRARGPRAGRPKQLRQALVDAVDRLLARERQHLQVADRRIGLEPASHGRDDGADATSFEDHVPGLLPGRDHREGHVGTGRTADVHDAGARVPLDADDAVARDDAGLLGRATVEDVEDA